MHASSSSYGILWYDTLTLGRDKRGKDVIVHNTRTTLYKGHDIDEDM